MRGESIRGLNKASLRARNEQSNPQRYEGIASFRSLSFAGLAITVAILFASCNSDQLINGSPAPEISVPDRNGGTINLSSFKGNLVLVNFWASWCKPCREESPNLVALYDKYKDASFKKADGFTIVSVSLDSEKDKWLRAIEQDNLKWGYHACDLKGWNSPAADSFRVSSIPSAFLIDQNGIIIGKDLKMKEFSKLLSMLAYDEGSSPKNR